MDTELTSFQGKYMEILVKAVRRSTVYRLALGAVVIAIVARAAAGQIHPVNPQGSYIFVNTAGSIDGLPDVAVPPLVVDLASIGVKPGDTVTMSTLGDFSYSCYPGVPGSCVEISVNLCGVFSTSSIIGPPSALNRVAGALTPNFSQVQPCVTGPTLFGGYPTDISQDFVINSSQVTVPADAAYLIVAVRDTFYADNADPNGDLALTIAPEYIPLPVLTFLGTNDYTGSDGNPYTSYSLSVSNWQLYPAEFFVLDNTLPPCGLNSNASRTWVRIFDQAGQYIYGFCALEHPRELTTIWFGLPRGQTPPVAVYITLWYRPLNMRWRSNLLPIADASPDGYPPIAEPLIPSGGTNLYAFDNNLFNYKVTYPPFDPPIGPDFSLVVQPVLISQPDLDALVGGTDFAGALIVPYDGTTGNSGVLFRATCEDSSHNPVDCPAPGIYDVKTSWEPTGQTIIAPAFLKAPVGTANWENIFTAYYEDRIDPTGSGRTCCRYSDFVFVDGGIALASMTPPAITITAPREGAVYTIKQPVLADYDCGILSNPRVTACLGTVGPDRTIDTSSPGTKTFQVNATVSSGPSAVKTVTYSVVYNTDNCLLYSPARYVKSGATFPIKLQICDVNGQNLSSPGITLHALGVTKINSFVPLTPLSTSGTVNPSRDFRFDSSLGIGGGYIVNVSTKGLSSGTWKLNFSIAGDPVTHSAKFGVQ